MNVRAIITLVWFGFATTAATAAAQGTPSKSQLSEIRSITSELEGRTEKLRDLMEQYRSLVEQRPQAGGGGPEAKKAHDEQLAKWDAALDRLMRRVDASRAEVVETKQRLDQVATGQLPTGLAKDVANAKNEAEAQRTAAEQALAKNKPGRTPKPAKQTPAEKPAPPIPDDL
jgi:uncharacterized protein YukE